MNGRLKIKLPIIVEGRYDKSTLSSMFDAVVVTTGGFGVFNSGERRALIKKLAEAGGIILLTDSDAGGRQIRSYLSGILPKDKLHHLYIPEVEGKEKRKRSPSKAGLLGVEGMSREILEKVLAPFVDTGACEEKNAPTARKMLTKLDFYNDKLTGAADSSARRDALAAHFGLPRGMSAGALIEALNIVADYDGYARAVRELFDGK